MSLTLEVTHDLGRLNEELALYLKLSKLSVQEVVDKKGRDLGIKLFKGFWRLRTKGSANPFAGPMFTLAKARGWRTRVRTRAIEVEPYLSIQKQGFFMRRVMRKGVEKDVKSRRSRRGLAVAQELSRRQHGAGLLGVSFLQRRWRSRSNGRYLAVNKSKKLGMLSTVESGPSADGAFYRIVNYTPGIDTVGGGRGLFATAIREVRQDTAVYLVRKQMQALRRSLNQSP